VFFADETSQRLIPNPVVDVDVDGQWMRATYRIVDRKPTGDVAFVRIAGDLPSPKRRQPKYRERVVVYGMATGVIQCGDVSGDQTVSLDANETGTVSGDSGGGVFSQEDGAFLGTVRGSTKAENRVVSFKPNDFAVDVASPPRATSKTVRINGRSVNATTYIARWYRQPWSYPGSIDTHLAEHGVSGFSGLTHAERERLHAAIHEEELRPVGKSAPARMPTQSCPSGNCPLQQPAYQQPSGHWGGLFGRRWIQD
jgi:hypothetical protein